MKPQFKSRHHLPSRLIFTEAAVIFLLISILLISNRIWAYSYQLNTDGAWFHVEFVSDPSAARSACISTAAKHGYDGEVICGVEYCHGQYTCFEGIGWLDEFKDITRRPAHSYSFHYPRYYLDNMEDHSTCPAVGNPISITNGNKIESVIDARFNGLDIERHYRSGHSGPLPTIGRQWSLFFEITMNENNSKLLVEKFIAENGVPSFPVPTHNTKANACRHGLPSDLFHNYAGLERRVSASNPDICEIVKDAKVVARLFIRKTINSPSSQNTVIITVQHPNGNEYIFELMKGVYYERNGKNAQLTINNTESIFQLGGVKYRFINNILDSIQNKNGEFKLSRNSSGLVDKIYRNGTSILDIDYDQNFVVAKISNGESVIEYGYENKKLITVKNNNVISYSYQYSPDSALLTEILDGKGNLLAKWRYDAKGRAISSEHANGTDKFTIDYTKFDTATVPEITVTNPLNKKTTYRYNFIDGQRKIINIEGHPTDNCAASNKAYTYTPEGWIASKTDWKGIKTTFAYNTAGQEISRIEAFGTPEARTITTEWHPTLFVKTKITEPGKQTVYSYDANGRLLNQSTSVQ